MAVERPDQVVLHFHWEEGGLQRQETYGPWAVAGDGLTHMAEVRDFIADWCRLTGVKPHAVVIALVTDPDQWVQERLDRAELDRLYVEQGVIGRPEIQRMRGHREGSDDDGST